MRGKNENMLIRNYTTSPHSQNGERKRDNDFMLCLFSKRTPQATKILTSGATALELSMAKQFDSGGG